MYLLVGVAVAKYLWVVCLEVAEFSLFVINVLSDWASHTQRLLFRKVSFHLSVVSVFLYSEPCFEELQLHIVEFVFSAQSELDSASACAGVRYGVVVHHSRYNVLRARYLLQVFRVSGLSQSLYVEVRHVRGVVRFRVMLNGVASAEHVARQVPDFSGSGWFPRHSDHWSAVSLDRLSPYRRRLEVVGVERRLELRVFLSLGRVAPSALSAGLGPGFLGLAPVADVAGFQPHVSLRLGVRRGLTQDVRVHVVVFSLGLVQVVHVHLFLGHGLVLGVVGKVENLGR